MSRSEPTPDRRTADRLDAADRRARPKLRELCDEVLASHRAATDRDVISDADRAEATRVLADVARRLARVGSARRGAAGARQPRGERQPGSADDAAASLHPKLLPPSHSLILGELALP